eukprot:CAMPEP_0182422650 /NCGR_PEP_ID=MMETSP1167-20130531/8388_1 /TAXON_ID=2988 /ORGANISM="Mallomonas Sp, Strain CCMP3275" /LENGTH=110 /DNA_ID=CAMNT_0024600877 /DNA_START=180 /DNA_END=512 /DNA_ORIENTATION=-
MKAKDKSEDGLQDLFTSLKSSVEDSTDNCKKGLNAQDNWSLRCQGISLTDIAISDRRMQQKNAKSLTGWKRKDGHAQYTTYRDGCLRKGTGQDGYILSLGDKKSKKRQKV